MTIQEAKKLIRKAHFSADKPLDSLDLAVEKIYAELFGITEQMEAELKAKDERIEAQSSVIIACQNTILQKDERIIELETERDKYNTIAANLQISRQKAYDNIAELEAIIEKMKSCENCKSYINVGSKCLLDIEDSLECRANNYLNWKLKDNE